MAAFPKYTYLHVTTATAQVIKSGVGTLAGVTVNKALVGTVTLKDGATTIAVLTNGTTAPLGFVGYGNAGGVQFTGPLTVTLTTSTEDLTVVYE